MRKQERFFFSVVVLLVGLCLFSQGTFGQEFYVSTDGEDGNGGTSPDDALPTIFAALNLGATEIIMLPGNYSAEGNTNLVVSELASFVISSSSVSDLPIIDCDGEPFLQATSLDLFEMSKIIIQNGAQALNLSLVVNVELQGCQFLNNVNPTGPGGAVYLSPASADSSVIIQGCLFQGNNATDDTNLVGSGGALYIESEKVVRVEFVENAFHENSAKSKGGAVYLNITEDSTVLFDCPESEAEGDTPPSMTLNSAEFGGFIYVDGASSLEKSDPLLWINNCRVNRNSARSSGGGIMLIQTTLKSGNSYYIENSASSISNGGALYIDSGTFNADLTSGPVFFLGNFASAGGGMYLQNPRGFSDIEGVSWIDNVGTKKSAADVYVGSGDGQVVFRHNIFTCEEKCAEADFRITAGENAIVELDFLLMNNNVTNTTVLDSLEVLRGGSVTIVGYLNAVIGSQMLEIHNLYLSLDSKFVVNGPLFLDEGGTFTWVGGSLDSGSDTPTTFSQKGSLILQNAVDTESTGPKNLENYNLVSEPYSSTTVAEEQTLNLLGSSITLQENSTWVTGNKLTISGGGSGTPFVVGGVLQMDVSTVGMSLQLLFGGQFVLIKKDDTQSPVARFSGSACFEGDVVMVGTSLKIKKDVAYGLVGYSSLGDNCGAPNSTAILGYGGKVEGIATATLLTVNTEGGDEGLGGGVVAAIVLGVFIVLLSGLVLAYYLWYKNKDDEIMLSESDNERGTSIRSYGSY